ncbi:helix-turn-helix domain-containing protein [Chitinophaga sp. XS-30]|uniref:helix-turn-helix domain-containing protein n=1 Tax=Chitinophaga sp. XS-30 TaxID=2604421 RepID=UPI0011DC789E|nr:helix-turn-helix transcriptional regulator [Chitinophaga sp. XS-30]QEH40926.1 helix-turn-helix transcriptional regulator [Chitinophaga sp. XS-30]
MKLNELTVYDVKSQIAKLSRTLRGFEGISQDQLAEQLNMSRITIQNLERPKNVTLDTFLKVLQHFDLLEKFDAFIAENIADKNVTPLY